MLCITRHIARKLGTPITFVGFRLARIETLGIRVQMPEAAMHEDDFAARAKNKIGLAGQIARVQPVTEAEGMDKAANDEFRFSVFRLNRRHVGRAPGWGEVIGHCSSVTC